MPSRNTDRIAEQRAVIAELERRLWSGGFNPDQLEPYQAAWRGLEALNAELGGDGRHHFVVVIPVADRPRHLEACLVSLLELCRVFGYGGSKDGRFSKIECFVADDSRDPRSIAAHRELVWRFDAAGLTSHYFGLEEQQAVLDGMNPETRAALEPMLGEATASGHKGASATRNLAFLRLAERYAGRADVLFHAIDSDQEFRVKLATASGDRDVYAVSYYHALDAIFSNADTLMLTGKVVGDPPVSPAVMAGNFLDDVIAFLHRSAGWDGRAPCSHHEDGLRREGEAAYHDMADLFGFRPAAAAYSYRCPLPERHDEAAGFDHFASRLRAFFYGEHPTRVSYYQYTDAAESVQPARTVYTGNYVFRPEGLKYFIPFAAQRLRMAGPSLGRIVRAEAGVRFVQANLPMLHRRTLEDTAESEFRPGVDTGATAIDLCGEYERQFYGDVMLFSVERLTEAGFPSGMPVDVAGVLDDVRTAMLKKYTVRRAAVIDKLRDLNALLDEPAHWWNRVPEQPAGLADFRRFAANVEHNFGADSPCLARISDSWPRWRAALLAAVEAYPGCRLAWDSVLAGVATARAKHGNIAP